MISNHDHERVLQVKKNICFHGLFPHNLPLDSKVSLVDSSPASGLPQGYHSSNSFGHGSREGAWQNPATMDFTNKNMDLGSKNHGFKQQKWGILRGKVDESGAFLSWNCWTLPFDRNPI